VSFYQQTIKSAYLIKYSRELQFTYLIVVWIQNLRGVWRMYNDDKLCLKR